MFACFVVESGSVDVSIPILLNKSLSPYSELSLSIQCSSGLIYVNPSHIIMQPVPLGITIHSEFFIIMDGFAR